MLQVGGELDLLEEPIGAEHGRQLGVQDLDGNMATVLDVFGEVHGRHAALTELALDAVAVGEGSAESRQVAQLSGPPPPRAPRPPGGAGGSVAFGTISFCPAARSAAFTGGS